MIFRQRLLSALRGGLLLSALTLAAALHGVGITPAHAQQLDRVTQVLFLAVDKNDLPGVQAAITGGADVSARDFNGMQAVDLAIERGYFDIAHYLISIRNQRDAQGKSATPAPSPQQLADAQRAKQTISAPTSPSLTPTPPAPTPQLPPGTVNPFETPQASTGLPTLGAVNEPAQAPTQAPAQDTGAATATETAMANAAPSGGPAVETEALAKPPAKPSATKSFFTTFTDFFKPPNTTGIVRRDESVSTTDPQALTEEELNKQLKEIDAAIGTDLIKGPAVPISPDELARELPPALEIPADVTALDEATAPLPELPPYSVTSPGAPPPPASQTPEVSAKDAFGDLAVSEATPEDSTHSLASAPLGDVLNTDLPFNGGVDPDILALLGMTTPDQAAQDTPTAEQVAEADPFGSTDVASDPFAAPAASGDPFSAPPTDKKPDSVASVLDGLDTPQEVAPLKTNKPPSPDGAPADPFAEPSDGAVDPFAAPAKEEVDELAGLFEGIGENVDNKKQDGWDVKEVENASLSGEVPAITDVEPTGKPLDGVELTLGADAVIGQPVGEDRMKMMDQETIHKPCMQKGGPETIFCVDKISWPFELEEDFLVDTIMYQGTRSIARYDAGRASYFHSLFNTGAFAKVVNYYISRFGQPTEKIDRAIAPLAQPRQDNPTYVWRTREPGTDSVITLEIRQFDDARGGFPDTRRGAILLYREHAGAIFPLLSQLELMVLKESGELDLTPKTPDTIW